MALGSQLSQWFGFQRALVILGDQATLAAAGTTQGTAAAITTANAIVTPVATGAGVVLPGATVAGAGDRIHVANHGANTLACYPPSGGRLSNNTANVPAMIAPNKCADFYCIDGTNYTANLSA